MKNPNELDDSDCSGELLIQFQTLVSLIREASDDDEVIIIQNEREVI